MYVLSPSVYAADYMNLKEQMVTLERMNVRRLHVDIMDGNFVPNLSFGPDFVKNLRENTKMELDVHLMIEEPIRFISAFAEAGADIITVHIESCDCVRETLDKIHSCGKKAGIVLKPETGLECMASDIWDRIQVLQFMTVQPGMKGQKFIAGTLDKIRAARSYIEQAAREIDIEVDGDITLTHLTEVLGAGANIVVVGKALFQGILEENIRNYQLAG